MPTAYLLYFVFALLGVGVYLLLPRSDRSLRAGGVLLTLAGSAALLVVLLTRLPGPEPGTVFFYLFAALAVLAAARVVTHPQPVFSALYFVLVVVSVAALVVLQQAEFLAIALIIIYAGAILVTYVFVIMLAHQRGGTVYDQRAREPFLGVLAGFVLMAAVAGRADQLPLPRQLPGELRTVAVQPADAGVAGAGVDADASAELAKPGPTLAMGQTVMTRYVVALELAGVLLLVAMLGAVALSRKRIPSSAADERRPIGEIGKEVEPF